MSFSFNHLKNHKISTTSAVLILLISGISAQAAGVFNSPSSGYLVCVNSKTKVVTHPGTSTCPKGSKKLILGAQGPQGLTGAAGLAGTNGKDGTDGKDGKTLWNGVKDPENTWGAPGDMFINSVTKTLFGPKNLDGTWPAGVSMIGPKGDQGPIGLTGPMGPQGPGGTGPQGPAGPAGPAGTTPTFTCAQGGTCQIGDRGPGGGIVFYIKNATADSPWRYLEAAPQTWFLYGGFSFTNDPSMAWCSSTNDLIKSTSTGSTSTQQTQSGIGSGQYNTKLMLNVCTFGAANAASAYNGGGKTDWFLPSKDELNEMYLASSVLGGFQADRWYWSSFENNSGSAWYQRMSDGFQTGYNKVGTQAYVRPIRAF